MSAVYYVTATIEGALNQWTTSRYGAGSGTHGRTIQRGLQHSGLRLVERADIRGGKLDVDAITLSIIATPEANDEFTRSAILLTYLSESVSGTGDTTINVRSNSLLVDESHVHIGTECMRITDPSTLAVTVVRAQRDTTAQIHNIVHGATASEVPVWSKVQAWEGRRVTLTVREGGADTSSRWIITQAPYLSDDGTTWLIDVDSVVKALDQEVGKPIDLTGGVRGMKYGTTSAFGFVYGTTSSFSLVGFYESEQTFLAALNTELAALSITGVDAVWATMTTHPMQGRCIQVWFDIGGADIVAPTVEFGSQTDGSIKLPGRGRDFDLTSNGVVVTRAVTDTTMLANQVYVCTLYPRIDAGALVGFSRAQQGGPVDTVHAMIHAVPSLVGADYPFHNVAADDVLTPEIHDASIMLDTDLGITAGDVLSLKSNTLPEDLRITVTGTFATRGILFDATADQLDDYCQRNGITTIHLDSSTVVNVTKSLGVGDLSDFMAALIAAAPYANSGAVPFITSNDVTTSATVVGAATRGIPCLEDRNYNVAEPISVLDMIAPELLLLGLMMATDTDGKIAFVPFFVPNKTTPVAVTFGASDIVTPHDATGMWPGWMPATDGIVSVVEMVGSKTVVWRSAPTSFRGLVHAMSRGLPGDPRVFIYRDIASVSAHKNRGLGTLSISPEASSGADLTLTEAMSIASRIVAFFGQPYEVVTIAVRRTATARALRLGSVIGLTSAHVPNSGDGTRGVSARRALIIGRDISLDPAENAAIVTFTVIMHTIDVGLLNVAGYAGSALTTGATNVSANIWDITVDDTAFAPTGSYDYEFFTVGDFVRVVQINDSTPNVQTGVITAISFLTLQVAFDGTAPWGGAYADSYVVEFADVATGMTDAQDDYCYTADSGLLLSNGNPARVLL